MRSHTRFHRRAPRVAYLPCGRTHRAPRPAASNMRRPRNTKSPDQRRRRAGATTTLEREEPVPRSSAEWVARLVDAHPARHSRAPNPHHTAPSPTLGGLCMPQDSIYHTPPRPGRKCSPGRGGAVLVESRSPTGGTAIWARRRSARGQLAPLLGNGAHRSCPGTLGHSPFPYPGKVPTAHHVVHTAGPAGLTMEPERAHGPTMWCTPDGRMPCGPGSDPARGRYFAS